MVQNPVNGFLDGKRIRRAILRRQRDCTEYTEKKGPDCSLHFINLDVRD